MLRFEWNALQVGDTVTLHDSADAGFVLRAGTVTMVEVKRSKRSKRGENGVGIRVGKESRQIVWPSFLTVHADPPDPTQACWLCAALEEAAPPRPVLSRLALSRRVGPDPDPTAAR